MPTSDPPPRPRRFLFSSPPPIPTRSDARTSGSPSTHPHTQQRRDPIADEYTATETERDDPRPAHTHSHHHTRHTHTHTANGTARPRPARIDSGLTDPDPLPTPSADEEAREAEDEFMTEPATDADLAGVMSDRSRRSNAQTRVYPMGRGPVENIAQRAVVQVPPSPRPSTLGGRRPGTSHSAVPPPAPSSTANASSTPLTSLYLVAGLPKSPHTWTLAEPDSVDGARHADGAVARWWRAEVLGSTVSPGVGGGIGKRGKRRGEGVDTQRMLAKALKLSFPKEVEIIASTLQPASTIHTFTFTLRPTPTTSQPSRSQMHLTLGASSSMPSLRTGGRVTTYGNASVTSFQSHAVPPAAGGGNGNGKAGAEGEGQTYYGTVLTVFSHADASRADAIRKALSTPSPSTPISTSGGRGGGRRRGRRAAPWGATSTPEATETEGEGLGEETEEEVRKEVGGSTLFLPRETVFWLPYALTLVSKHPIYDLMRDFLTLSWARFSKDVQSHSLQIAKILEHPCPRSGEIVKLDAGAEGESVEVVCRFPGGLDFGRGLVDVNFTMWPLFRALNLDNILTICEIALAPTGRVLFLSRYPAMLGIAVSTIKYIVELRGWSGLSHPAVHSRDARIYLEDPGPWLIGLHADCRLVARPSREVCVVDVDINSVHCAMPPAGAVSTKAQRDRFRRTLMAAFEGYFHPDYSVPSEFKEAFPAGRFRPLCSIKTKRGAPSAVYAEVIPPPEWWFQPRVLQAFDTVLRDKYKKPSLLKRLTMMGMGKRQAQLTTAEQLIQRAIRRRATAFVDARDDLETKIGRLSRRLNFLITESDLWREKFVAFEGYAEKLSAEAGELRAKIGKEQRESRRVSGLLSATAQEKAQLQTKLSQVEMDRQDAIVQLEQMRLNMEAMEREREQMVAEVEEQIERALASMSFTEGLSDGSRPGTAMSSSSAGASTGSRPGSANGRRMPRSFSTSTTLADHAGEYIEEEIGAGGGDLAVGRSKLERLDEEEEEREQGRELDRELERDFQRDRERQRVRDAQSPARKKRFSASLREREGEDNMVAVDQGISEKSDRITEKVNQIQHKLEAALADLEHKRRQSSPRASLDDIGHETDQTAHSSRRRARTPGGSSRADTSRMATPPVPTLHVATPRVSSQPGDTRAAHVVSPLAHLGAIRDEPEPESLPEPEPEPDTQLEDERAETEPAEAKIEMPEAEEQSPVEDLHVHEDDDDKRASSMTAIPPDVHPYAQQRLLDEEEDRRASSMTATPSNLLPIATHLVHVEPTAQDAEQPPSPRATAPMPLSHSPGRNRMSRMTMMSTTDGGDSDTDFQSAYSSSPVDKTYLDEDDEEVQIPGNWDDESTRVDPTSPLPLPVSHSQQAFHSIEKAGLRPPQDDMDDLSDLEAPRRPRSRVSSTATATGKPPIAQHVAPQ